MKGKNETISNLKPEFKKKSNFKFKSLIQSEIKLKIFSTKIN